MAEPAGLLWTWWRGDPLPALPPLPGLTVERTDVVRLLADVTQLDTQEVTARLRGEHRPYLARMGSTPVAFGWCATREARFGSPVVRFSLPAPNGYLWDFVTFPEWRGRGVYARLLQAILVETAGIERFWILHQMANSASARGIAKAGFRMAGEVRFLRGGGLAVTQVGPVDRAQAGAHVLGLPLVGGESLDVLPCP